MAKPWTDQENWPRVLSKTVSLEDVTAKVQFSFGPQEMEADTKTIVIAMVMRLPFTPLQSVVLPNLVISRGILRLVRLPWQLHIGKNTESEAGLSAKIFFPKCVS